MYREHGIKDGYVVLERNYGADCLAWLGQNAECEPNETTETNNCRNPRNQSVQQQNTLVHNRSRRASIASTSVFAVQNSVVETGSDYLSQIPKSIQVASAKGKKNVTSIAIVDANKNEINDENTKNECDIAKKNTRATSWRGRWFRRFR